MCDGDIALLIVNKRNRMDWFGVPHIPSQFPRTCQSYAGSRENTRVTTRDTTREIAERSIDATRRGFFLILFYSCNLFFILFFVFCVFADCLFVCLFTALFICLFGRFCNYSCFPLFTLPLTKSPTHPIIPTNQNVRQTKLQRPNCVCDNHFKAT